MIAVCIATYNQEQYLAQAIESALSQRVDEPVRLYIGDDASTDGTAAICHRYKDDERVIYLRHAENLGLLDNTLTIYRRIQSDGCDYIAQLDGDDYWIDDTKLQQEINYLRSHPETGIVHTAAYDETAGRLVDNDSPIKPVGDIHLCYNLRGACQTNCTVVFRTNLLKANELYAIQKEHFPVLDYPLYGLFAQRTKFGYIHRYTAVWRSHPSVSQPSDFSRYWHYKKERIRMWRWLDNRYPNRFHYRRWKAAEWLFLQFIQYFLQKMSLFFA